MNIVDVLKKYNLIFPDGAVDCHSMDLAAAMDEYAKQQAIAFGCHLLITQEKASNEKVYAQFLKIQCTPL